MLTRADGGVVMATPPLPALSEARQASEPAGGAVALPGARGRAGACVAIRPGRPRAPGTVDWRNHNKCCCFIAGIERDLRQRELGRPAGCLTWTEGDDRAGLPLDLDSHPTVHLLFARAGCSSSLGLGAATASVAGN